LLALLRDAETFLETDFRAADFLADFFPADFFVFFVATTVSFVLSAHEATLPRSEEALLAVDNALASPPGLFRTG
jgi:hypothetical protein